jgi:hypothetical protein
MKKVLKWTAIILACGFVLLQFSRPARTNPVGEESRALEASLHVTPEVKAIFARACDDCHSNRTRWPWYSHVAPVSWWLTDHVRHGRRHMNFSDWARYNQRDADQMLGEICRLSKMGVMPLSSYTLMHRDAILSPQDVGALCAWSQAEQQRLAASVEQRQTLP